MTDTSRSGRPRLKIWIIAEGEGLPMVGDRLMRVGMLAKYLSEQGHDVVWWSSTFMHGKKAYYCDEYRECALNDHETLVLLHAKHAYKTNMSPARVRYLGLLAKEFRRRCGEKERPDIILCAWPTMEFAREAVRYGREHHVPVIVDIRDLWPDIFTRAFPKAIRWAAPLALLPMKLSARRTLRGADQIMAMSPPALEWGCRYAGRSPGPMDRYIPIGNDPPRLTEQEMEESLRWWRGLGVTEKTWNISFFGSLSKTTLDLDTVIQAVRKIAEKHPDIRLLIGGKGDGEDDLRSLADGSENIVFAGWADQKQMNSAMAISKCGMYCMRNLEDFRETFSNKAIQYLSAGLPVINSLTGFARTYLDAEQIGYTYTEGDPDSCAEMIEKLMADEPARRAMGERALRQFNERFDSRVVNGQFETYFYDVLEQYE